MLTIISGIVMVIIMHGAFISQIWFRIKMILVLLIILNASFFARTQNKKLDKLLTAANNATNQLNAIKSKMNLYYAIQFIFLMTIFVLSVFRFIRFLNLKLLTDLLIRLKQILFKCFFHFNVIYNLINFFISQDSEMMSFEFDYIN